MFESTCAESVITLVMGTAFNGVAHHPPYCSRNRCGISRGAELKLIHELVLLEHIEVHGGRRRVAKLDGFDIADQSHDFVRLIAAEPSAGFEFLSTVTCLPMGFTPGK